MKTTEVKQFIDQLYKPYLPDTALSVGIKQDIALAVLTRRNIQKLRAMDIPLQPSSRLIVARVMAWKAVHPETVKIAELDATIHGWRTIL